MPNVQIYNPGEFSVEELRKVFKELFMEQEKRRVALNWDTLGPGARAAINEAIRKEFGRYNEDLGKEDPEAIQEEGDNILTIKGDNTI